jgi:tetratricopeptide (TPR) repeat protein
MKGLGPVKTLTALLVAAMAVVSCGSPYMQPSRTVEEGPRGPETVDRGIILSPGAESQLRHGALLSSEGKFEEAARAYLRVYENPSHEAKHREEALLRLGGIYSNVLNTGKDYDKALHYLQKLLDEFPESRLREEAEEKIETIREMRRGAPE